MGKFMAGLIGLCLFAGLFIFIGFTLSAGAPTCPTHEEIHKKEGIQQHQTEHPKQPTKKNG